MHWMAEGDPEQVNDKSVRAKVFDWKVPIEVDGRAGAITGTLFWTPVSSSGLPLLPILAFVAVAVPLCIAVMIVRRRRRAGAGEAPDDTSEAW